MHCLDSSPQTEKTGKANVVTGEMKVKLTGGAEQDVSAIAGLKVYIGYTKISQIVLSFMFLNCMDPFFLPESA